MKLISVIMSVYNDQTYLSYAIESILMQNYSNIEFIIIDDGSTDNSIQIIKEYAKKDKRIITIFNKTNIGITKSLNKGLDIAKGLYIARQDADDFSLISRLSSQLNYLENHGLDLVGCKARLINKNNLTIGKIGREDIDSKDIYRLLKKGINPLIHGSILFKNDGIRRYDPFFKCAQDYNFYLRNDFQIGILPLRMYSLRIHDKSITSNKFKEQRFYLLYAKYYNKILKRDKDIYLIEKFGVDYCMKIKFLGQDICDEYFLRIAWYYIFNKYDISLALEALSNCNKSDEKLIMIMFTYLPRCIIRMIYSIRKRLVYGNEVLKHD